MTNASLWPADRPVSHLVDVGEVLRLLASYRYTCASESLFQSGIERVLEMLPGVSVEREFALSKSDRIDFLINGSIGLECKVDGSTTDVVRQLSRYAQHERIEALILATTRRRHALQMPAELHGKRVFTFVSGAWTP